MYFTVTALPNGIRSVELPTPPDDFPMTVEETATYPEAVIVAMVKRALRKQEEHRHVGEGGPCNTGVRASDTISYLCEMRPEILVNPILFHPARPGSERYGR